MGKKSIQEIARVLVEKNALDASTAEQFVTTMFSVIQQALEQGQQVKVRGLGTFKIIDVDARESVNVNTGERVLIAGHGKVSFTPDTTMRELVNKPFSQFETVALNDGVEFENIETTAVPVGIKAFVDELETPATEDDANDDEEITEMPKVERLAQDETPEEETPIEETPIEVTPAEAVPAEEPVVAETPSEEPVVEEASLEESVVDEAPVEEQVVEEVQEISEVPEEQETSEEQEASENQEVPEEQVIAEEKEVPEEKEALVEEVNYREEITDDPDEESSSSWRWILGVLGVLLLMAACAAGGYYFGYGQGLEKGMAVVKEANDSLAVVAKTDSLAAQNDSLAAKQDSIGQTEAPAEEVLQPEENTPAPAEKQPEAPAQPKPEAKKEVPAEKKVETPAPEQDQYAAKDVRVRYGGYRIVGLDHTEKIRPGDTPARIAKRTLGEGMECYIEVYNGWSANQQLKEGQTVKIPKVESKKKKRQ